MNKCQPHQPVCRALGHTLVAGLLLAGPGPLGCSALSDDDKRQAGVQPDDFVAPDDGGTPADTAGVRVASVSLNDDAPDAPEATATTDRTNTLPDEARAVGSRAVSVNAMVGHINGEAVYADQIFDVNVIAQLQTFGRRYDGEMFLRMAYPVIEERLRGVIIDKLILGEAELNLKENERLGIDRLVQREREELMRFYGQGSIAKARAEFQKDRGLELDAYLLDYREELSIGIYIRARVLPKISVSQINIENYYEDNLGKYHRPTRRAFRMIRVADDDTAQAARARLDRGEPFDKVASDEAVNLYNPGGGGVFNNGEPYPGDFGIAPVNEALQALEEGGQAGPILAGKHQYFVRIDRLEPGVKIPLAEAQIEIEKILRAQAFERHVRRFRTDVYGRGNFSDPERMGQKLLEIAMARYDR